MSLFTLYLQPFNKFIYLFIFGCVGSSLLCVQAFSSCSEWGLLFVAVRRLLIAVASLIAEHVQASVVVAYGLSSCGSWALERRLSSCGARAQLFSDMWDLPRPGLEPVSPALAGGFLTTAPPGKPHTSPLMFLNPPDVLPFQDLCTLLFPLQNLFLQIFT